MGNCKAGAVLSSSTLQSLFVNSLSESREFDMVSLGKVWIVVKTPLVSRVPVDVAGCCAVWKFY